MRRKYLFGLIGICILLLLRYLFSSDPKLISDRLINILVLGVTALMFLWTLYDHFCINVSTLSVTWIRSIPNSADWFQVDTIITNNGQKTAAIKRVVLDTDIGEKIAQPSDGTSNQLAHGASARYEFHIRKPVRMTLRGLFVEDYNNKTWHLNEKEFLELSSKVKEIYRSRGWA